MLPHAAFMPPLMSAFALLMLMLDYLYFLLMILFLSSFMPFIYFRCHSLFLFLYFIFLFFRCLMFWLPADDACCQLMLFLPVAGLPDLFFFSFISPFSAAGFFFSSFLFAFALRCFSFDATLICRCMRFFAFRWWLLMLADIFLCFLYLFALLLRFYLFSFFIFISPLYRCWVAAAAFSLPCFILMCCRLYFPAYFRHARWFELPFSWFSADAAFFAYRLLLRFSPCCFFTCQLFCCRPPAELSIYLSFAISSRYFAFLSLFSFLSFFYMLSFFAIWYFTFLSSIFSFFLYISLSFIFFLSAIEAFLSFILICCLFSFSLCFHFFISNWHEESQSLASSLSGFSFMSGASYMPLSFPLHIDTMRMSLSSGGF